MESTAAKAKSRILFRRDPLCLSVGVRGPKHGGTILDAAAALRKRGLDLQGRLGVAGRGRLVQEEDACDVALSSWAFVVQYCEPSCWRWRWCCGDDDNDDGMERMRDSRGLVAAAMARRQRCDSPPESSDHCLERMRPDPSPSPHFRHKAAAVAAMSAAASAGRAASGDDDNEEEAAAAAAAAAGAEAPAPL